MGEIKQTNNIKNPTCYFYNNIIGFQDFDAWLLKIDKKSYKNIVIYNIGYIAIKKNDDCKNIHSVNSLYCVLIMQMDILKKNGRINIWFLALQMEIKS